MFEAFDISTELRVRPEPLRETRFVLDVHLGKLAAYLRMLGFDARYQSCFSDEDLATISAEEQPDSADPRPRTAETRARD